MKKNQKGFTFVEILGIVTLLSVIILIVAPKIKNTIDNSKVSSYMHSAISLRESISRHFINSLSGSDSGFTCSFPTGCDGLKLEGEMPTSGSISVLSNGDMSGTITFRDKYTYCIANDTVLNGTCSSIALTGLSLTNNSISLAAGDTYTISDLSFKPGNSTNRSVSYSSVNSSVASVTSSGVVTANSTGTTRINISGSGGSVTTQLTVNVVNPVTSITGVDSITIGTNETASLNLEVNSSATNGTLTYLSHSATIASVNSSGVISGLNVGNTEIEVRSVSNPNVSKNVRVNVIYIPPLESITLPSNSINIGVGVTYSILPIFEPINASNGVTYTSSDSSIVSVTSGGVVTGVSFGSASIVIASTSNPSKTVTLNVNVLPPIGTTYTFAEPKMHEFTALAGVRYKLEVWGAQGGNGTGNSTYIGGLGGYSVGILYVISNTDMYVYVGGEGINSENSSGGGINGGGNCGTSSSSGSLPGGGGGATDIRINSDSLYARVIVAGGGGGNGTGSTSREYTGGAGGGLSGIQSTHKNNEYQSRLSYPGTQIGGGNMSSSNSTGATKGTFGNGGKGGNGQGAGAGGGGGWYGGGGAGYGSSMGGAASGGSGWIYTETSFNTWQSGNPTDAANWLLNSSYYLADACTCSGNGICTNSAGTTYGTWITSETSNNGTGTKGQKGNGYARITVIGYN